MRIERRHDLEIDELKVRVDELADDLKDRLNLDTRWDGHDLRISGSGVKGAIFITADSVIVDVRLGLPVMLMEGMIRAEIMRTMDEHLSDPDENSSA